jgi:hypothetical protein
MKKNLILLTVVCFTLVLISEIFVKFFFTQDLQRYWVIDEPSYGLYINKKNHFHKLHKFKSHEASYSFGEYHNRITLKNSEKVLNKPKVLVLGDSFTFGWLIKDKNTFVHKLQEDNLNYNFINIAVGAWGSAQYTLFADMFCEKIKPKKIFVFLNTDDFYRGYKSNYYKEIDGILVKNKQPFKNTQKDSNLDKKIPFYKFLKSNSHLFMLTRNIVYNLKNKPVVNEWSKKRYWPRPTGEFDEEYSKKISEFNKKVYLKLNDISNKCGSSLHILNIMWSNHSFMQNSNPNKLFFKSVKNFFKENNIDYFESDRIMKTLYENPMEYIIDVDFHPNKKGAELIYLNFKNKVKKILLD